MKRLVWIINAMFGFFCLVPTPRGLPTRSSGLKQAFDPVDKPWDVGTIKSRIASIAICFLLQTPVFAGVSLEISPNKISLGEAFRLDITSDDTRSCGMPNLIPLQKDFTVAGTERSMSYTVVNGRAQSTCHWTVTLMPNKAGILPIPMLAIGPVMTKASSIEVLGEPGRAAFGTLSSDKNEALMLKTVTNPKAPFVNQQVLYTVRLYNSQRLLDASYQPPAVEDSLVIPLGDVDRYQTAINGREYAVEEQQYAIFPQKSGGLQITPPVFEALVYDQVPRRVRTRAEGTSLTVKPMPSEYKGKHWLPAKEVALSEQYDSTALSFTEGDTLVRTVVLQAFAAPAQLLPTLSFKSSEQFSVYPEKGEEHNAIRDKNIVGRTTFKVTYLLNKSGHITLPAVEVPWFNTTTGKEEMASLPARNLMVEPKAHSGRDLNPPPIANNKDTISHNVPIGDGVKSLLPWWIAIGFAFLWVLTLLLWWFRYGFLKRRQKVAVLKRLRVACLTHQPEEARIELLRWASLQWPGSSCVHLNDLASASHDSHFKEQLQLLSQALYSSQKDTCWNGEALWHSVMTYHQANAKDKPNSHGLPPMNPS